VIAVVLRRIPVLVPILALFVASVVFGGTFTAEDTPAIATEPGFVLSPSTPSRPALDSAATFATIVERPLFSPNRRPAQQPPPQPAAPAAKAQQVAPPALSATLVGVFISPEVSSAIVRLANGKTASVSEGDMVDGWVLKRVTPDLAQFDYGTATIELTFPVHEAAATGVSISTTPGAPVRRRR
jgi:hypothetical protein